MEPCETCLKLKQEIIRLREALKFIIAESDSMGGGMKITGYFKAKQALATEGDDGQQETK